MSGVVEEATPPPFNRTRKIILAVAGFFLLVSILAQVPWFADKIENSKIKDKIPTQVSSEYEKEEGKYEEMGSMGGKEGKFAKVNEEKESY